MKKFLLVPALALVISNSLSGCAGSLPTSIPSVSQIVSTVLSLCTTGCQFVPDADSIVAIINKADPLFETTIAGEVVGNADAIADYLCAQVKAAQAAGTSVAIGPAMLVRFGKAKAVLHTPLLINGKPVYIDGVIVTGHFL
jgi:hypothetical protein